MSAHPYDHTLRPPGPVVSVTLSHPVSGTRPLALPARLDTGADLTILPQAIAEELDLPARGHIWSRSFNGLYSRHTVYYARIQVEGVVLGFVRCLAVACRHVLLGRNVLNRFMITLNGKDLTFEMKDP